MGDSRLTSTFASMEFVNPFLLASGPATKNAAMIRRAFKKGWAGAVTKTAYVGEMGQEGYAPGTRPLLAPVAYRGRLIGMENVDQSGILTVEDWEEQVPALKREYPDRVVIGSIIADARRSAWQRAAKGLERAGVDALELNMSCTHAYEEARFSGKIVGESPELVSRIISWVTAVIDIPVIAKLPALLSSVQEVVTACAESGADGVAAINTLPCIAGVDLEELVPLPTFKGKSTYGGYSGPAVKPVALGIVARMARAGILPVCGMGGIGSWQDAAEFILLGASTIQVCTAVMWHGYDMVRDLTVGLDGYLARKGIANVGEVVGEASGRLVPHVAGLDYKRSLTAQVLRDECTGCGRCVVSCRDGGYGAVRLIAGKACVDPAVCGGCGLCTLVCPTDALVLRAM